MMIEGEMNEKVENDRIERERKRLRERVYLYKRVLSAARGHRRLQWIWLENRNIA